MLGNRGGGGLYREVGDERLSNEGINEDRRGTLTVYIVVQGT